MLETILSESKGISIDSREDVKGKIFFALQGENFNGNDYAIKALSSGAICAVVDDEKVFEKASREHLQKLYFVDNALVALQDLALAYRKCFDIPVVAITGTNGKTTTKELLAASLSKKLKVASTQGNLNNHIGVPLTLLSIVPDTEIAVIEMGANKRGDIKELCRIALPTHGIITNIGVAHLEGFGSKGTIAKTKCELYQHLNEYGGTAFVNKKDTDLLKLAKKIMTSKRSRMIVYGDEKLGTIKNVHLLGGFNVENMRAAYAIAYYFGVSSSGIGVALKEYKPDNMRSQKLSSGNKRSGNEILLDAYNANPSSMKVSLSAFSDEKSEKNKWAILGDMKELGKGSIKEHAKLIRYIQPLNIKNIVYIGKEFYKAKNEIKILPKNSNFFKSKEDFKNSSILKNINRSFVFIKGSRGMKMEELVQVL